MLMNYHEMTLNEPRDSPAKRKQFTIITAVMAAFFSYAIMTSGVLLPIEATEGIFPGGNFCYKLAHRDYAASLALGRRVIHDVVGSEKTPTDTESRPVEEIMYHLFLDSPREVGGRNLRWATGILVADKEKEKVDKLLSLNQPKGKKAEAKRYPTEQEMIDLSASEAMDLLPYEVTDLPSVDSLVVQFPHTHGFVSALTMSYKVIPAMRRMAIEKGGPGIYPAVISTCRKDEEMCTLYAPLVQTKDFFLGLPDSQTYQKDLPAEQFIFSYGNLKGGIYKLAPEWARKYVDMMP